MEIVDIFLDFETRSRIDIKRAGGEKYTRNIDRLLCMAYRIGVDSETKLWKHGDPPPQDLFDAIEAGNCRLNAFNATFEEAVWRNHCVPVLGWIPVHPNIWHCSAARSRALALPGSLGMTGEALRCEVTKDQEGRTVMLQLSKPRKPSKDNPSEWYEDEERLQKLYSYCISDVDSEISIWEKTRPLAGIERDVWLLDQEINRRGVKIDRELVVGATDVWTAYQAELNRELADLTIGIVTRANQRQRIETWLKRVHDVEVESLDKEHLPKLLERTDLPKDARRVLEIRQELAVSSVAKFSAMEKSMCEDDRARGVQLYCGASQTGRWAGRLIQTQNIARGVISYKSDEDYWNRVEDYIAQIKEGKFEIHKDQAKSTTGEILSSLIRPAICADTGKKLIVCDYSKVELCGNGWVSDQENLLEQRRNNEDPYKHMAAAIHHMDVKDVVKGSDEYQLGKAASLGCFAADTVVVTDNGNKRIVDVTTDDKLWDGVEWVSHEGLLDQGVKQVIDLDGISVTPDHKFLTKEGWVRACQLDESTELKKSAKELATLPSADIFLENEAGFSSTPALAIAAASEISIPQTYMPGELSGAMTVQKSKAPELGKIGTATETSSPITSSVKCGSTGTPRSGLGVTTQRPDRMNSTEPKEFESILGGTANKLSFQTSSRNPAGMIPDSQSTGSVLRGTTVTKTLASPIKESKPGISELRDELNIAVKRYPAMSFGGSTAPATKLRDQLIRESIEDYRPSRLSGIPKTTLKRAATYDIRNAGPRHRFTIVSPSGERYIVHNCGYGMGADKFFATCQKFGMAVDRDMAKHAVDTFRSTYDRIRTNWYETEDTAKAAIRDPGTEYKCPNGKISYLSEDKWLFGILPSGRRLAYMNPRIEPRLTSWGEERPTIVFDGYEMGKWLERTTYAGKLVENYVQALCRDLLAESMLLLDLLGVDIIFHVHDEVVAEVPEDSFWTVPKIEEVMSILPKWAEGFPLAAEGFEAYRYKK